MNKVASFIPITNIMGGADCYYPQAKLIAKVLQLEIEALDRLTVINMILETKGVEYIKTDKDSSNLLNGRYGLSYCNTGEMTATTIGYDHNTESFYIGSAYNWVGSNDDLITGRLNQVDDNYYQELDDY